MINVLLRKANDSGIDNVTALQIAVNATTIDKCEELASMFDLIVASSVCSFLPNYEETVGDLTSVLNPGGCFVQWDWLAEMPADRIQNAFKGSGLLTHSIEEAFSMNTEEKSMAVIMGIGRLPL
jgi:predicted TPR repeat methyltransferase